MAATLRSRLLLWYSAVLTLVMALFGSAVCYVFWRSLVSRVDGELGAGAAAVARSLRPAAAGAFDLDLPDEALAVFQQPDARSYYAIMTAEGALVDASDPDNAVPRPEEPGTRMRDGRRELAVAGPAGTIVVVGRELSQERAAVRALALTVGAVGLAALGLSLAGGWFLAGRALAPIARIDRTARAMAGGALSARIPIDRTESELGQVAAALNTAFDRLDAERERQRRFTADASHELRTPLTTILTELDWALSRERGPAEYRESLETCRRAGARMRKVVEGLLTLARADAGELPLAKQRDRADRIAEDVAGMVRPLAVRRGVSIDVRAEPIELEVDPDRLRDALANVVTNGVQYTRVGGSVEISVHVPGDAVEFRVADDGPGIAPSDLPHIFERFYRGDKARSSGGAGLGLAIARLIVERHGGEITCTSRPGCTEFVIRVKGQPGGVRPGSDPGLTPV